MNFKPRACARCSATYQPTGSSQRVCLDCKPLAHAERHKASVEAWRRAQGFRIVGDAYPCATCGEPFILKAGPQIRCAPCQHRFELDRSNQVNKAHLKRREWRKIAKERAMFGGNKEAVLDRDGRACRKCGATSGLHVHHIDGRGKGVPFYERNNAAENLITLCNTCHNSVHAYMSQFFYVNHPDSVLAAYKGFMCDMPIFQPKGDAPNLFRVDDEVAQARRKKRSG